MNIQDLIIYLAIALIVLFMSKKQDDEKKLKKTEIKKPNKKNPPHINNGNEAIKTETIQPRFISLNEYRAQYKNIEQVQSQDRSLDENQPQSEAANLTHLLQDLNILKWDKAFLKSLEWKRYEEICMEYLRIKNCVADVTCNGADGGVDIEIRDKDGALFAIAQCKSWSKPIGVALIRELYGVMASEKVKYGIFLTTSVFSPDAIEFAKSKSLILIDADEFVKLINELNEEDRMKLSKIATEGDYTTPTCVKCNVKMVRRVAKNGNNAGNEFWGCVNYPRCKHKMFVKA